MLLSTGIYPLITKYGEDEAIRLAAEAGFDAVDVGLFEPAFSDGIFDRADVCAFNDRFFEGLDADAYAGAMRRKIEAAGLVCNQCHAPFLYPGEGTEEGYFRAERAIRIAGILGAKHIVVHPVNFSEGRAQQKECNLVMYRRLGDYARASGTKIAIENVRGTDSERKKFFPCGFSFADEVCDYYDSLNDPASFNLLLDVGHCAVVGQAPQDAIRVLGHNRLQGLHIQDNDGVGDLHNVPYDAGSCLNWDAVTAALGEIDYQGDFTYEANTFLKRHNAENIHIALKYMEQLGRYLMKKIDAHRPK